MASSRRDSPSPPPGVGLSDEASPTAVRSTSLGRRCSGSHLLPKRHQFPEPRENLENQREVSSSLIRGTAAPESLLHESCGVRRFASQLRVSELEHESPWRRIKETSLHGVAESARRPGQCARREFASVSADADNLDHFVRARHESGLGSRVAWPVLQFRKP